MSTTTRRIITSSIVFSAIFFFVLSALELPLSAKVTGPCANCHTMHNSQNGSPVARTGTGTGWNGSNQLAGGTVQTTPLGTLLTTDCVGCHTSTGSAPIVSLAGNDVPIVYNMTAPSTTLAGGNFHWVAQGGAENHKKGHNVFNIAPQDLNLNSAPGANPAACGDSTCHTTLAVSPGTNNYDRGGCQGCHVFTYHHENNNNTMSGVYRYLKGHGSSPTFPPLPSARRNITSFPDYVKGIGDSDWEYTKSAADHNFYNGSNAVYTSNGAGLTNQKTVSAFCAGCHSVFHDEMGSGSPWLRHPSDKFLPQTGEYGGYNPVTSYSTEAPVAWTNPATPARAEAVVMCLSCHRAHGSDQPDMLRWDYSAMNAGNGGAAAGKGCFTCHTGKD
ncbi:MAG: cytochrome c3 family protein [Nitrospirota bacterium]